MVRRLSVFVVCGCLMLASQMAHAADAPLSVFPSDTGVIVKLASPNKFIQNVADAVNMVQPGFGGIVQGQAQAIGIGISNPTLQGVDMDKDWWMGVFMQGEDEPQVVFVIPATDIKDMEDAIDESFAFTKSGSWGIYSEDEEAVKRVQTLIDGRGKSIEATLSGKLLSSFGTGDVSIFVNTPTLVTMYSEQLQEAVDEAKEEIANMDSNPGISEANAELLKQYLPQLLGKAVDALKDNVGMVMTINAGTKGLQINKIAVQKPSSESANFLTSITSANIDDILKGLPANQPCYLASSIDFTKLALVMYDVMEKKDDLDAETKTALTNLTEAMKKISSKGFGTAVGLGDLEGGVLRTYSVQLATPPDVMKKITKDTQKIMGLFSSQQVQQEITYEENKETVEGKPVDIMHIDQDFGGDPQMRQMAEMIMGVMYGPDGLTTRIMYTKDGALQSIGGGTTGIEETYRAWEAKDNMKTGSPLARDRGALPSKMSYVNMFDLVTLLAHGAVIAAESGQVPIPITPEQIESIDVQPSYLGVALTVEDNAVEGRLNIPIEQFQNGAKLATSIMQMMQSEVN